MADETKTYTRTTDEWEQQMYDKLNNYDYTLRELQPQDGIVVQIKNCKCPNCDFEQMAFYELPTDKTRYEHCMHEHDGVPKRL